jgi:hypothetical protein
MAKKYIKKCLTFLTIKKMQIKMTSHPARMTITQNINNIKLVRMQGKKEPLYTVGGNVN